ncbi:MAG: FTR1 family iron permease [Brevinematia bacterium]
MFVNFFQGFIISFREGLEMFLILGIALRVLKETKKDDLKKYLWYGSAAGMFLSVMVALLLKSIDSLYSIMDVYQKLWESITSFLALVLISSLILWMIKHGKDITSHIEMQTKSNLSKSGIFLLSIIIVLREGLEIALFAFVGKYSFVSVGLGMVSSLILVLLIYFSSLKISFGKILTVTLAYIILQAGYLLGYSIHEFLSYLKSINYIASDSIFLIKVFDLSKGFLDHKTGILGLILNVILGWYSKPEWLQFTGQYLYTIFLFIYLFIQWKIGDKHEI